MWNLTANKFYKMSRDNDSTTEVSQISELDQTSLTNKVQFPFPGNMNQVLNQIETSGKSDPENTTTNEDDEDDEEDDDEQVYDAATGDASDPSDPQCGPVFEPATIWTRKDVKEFKVVLISCSINI